MLLQDLPTWEHESKDKARVWNKLIRTTWSHLKTKMFQHCPYDHTWRWSEEPAISKRNKNHTNGENSFYFARPLTFSTHTDTFLYQFVSQCENLHPIKSFHRLWIATELQLCLRNSFCLKREVQILFHFCTHDKLLQTCWTGIFRKLQNCCTVIQKVCLKHTEILTARYHMLRQQAGQVLTIQHYI